MGAAKDLMELQQRAADREVVDECDLCGAQVTSEQVNSMPFERGLPVFVYCPECMALDR